MASSEAVIELRCASCGKLLAKTHDATVARLLSFRCHRCKHTGAPSAVSPSRPEAPKGE